MSSFRMWLISIIVAISVSICNGQWISPSTPIIPIVDELWAVGYHQDIVTLLGGRNNRRDLIEYSISNNSFNYIDDTTLTTDVFSFAQGYTQMDGAVYFVRDSQINRYDLITKEFRSNWNNAVIPQNVGAWYACIASANQVLYIAGGYYLDLLQIYDIASNTWSRGPRMDVQRKGHGCVISPVTDTLYAIGGSTLPDHIEYNTVEYISINDLDRWRYTNNDLSKALSQGMAVAYDNYVYVIGGWGDFWDVHIINVLTNTISVSPHKLAYSTSGGAPVIVGDRLYVFAGGGTKNRFQYYDLPIALPTESCDCYDIILANRGNNCYRYEVHFCDDKVNSVILGVGNAEVQCGVTDVMDVLNEAEVPSHVTYTSYSKNGKVRGLKLDGLITGDKFKLCFDENKVGSTLKGGYIKYQTDSMEIRCKQRKNLPDLCGAITNSASMSVQSENREDYKQLGLENQSGNTVTTYIWSGLCAALGSIITVLVMYMVYVKSNDVPNYEKIADGPDDEI